MAVQGKEGFEQRMKDIEEISDQLAISLKEFDQPIPPFSKRFPGRLESAVGSAFQTYGGKFLITTKMKRLSALFYYLCKGHCFPNGNKRIAMTTLLTLLFLDGQWLKIGIYDFYGFAERVAGTESVKKEDQIKEIQRFIKDHLISIKK